MKALADEHPEDIPRGMTWHDESGLLAEAEGYEPDALAHFRLGKQRGEPKIRAQALWTEMGGTAEGFELWWKPPVMFKAAPVGADPGLAVQFLQERNYKFPVLLAKSLVDDMAGEFAIPRNWISDANGVLREECIGYASADWPERIPAKLEGLLGTWMGGTFILAGLLGRRRALAAS
jgi:hypothetical protein